MKKTFTFWKSLFLLFALIVGSSNAWGQDSQTFTAGTDTGDGSVTKGVVTVSMSTMNRTDNYRTNSGTNMTVEVSSGYLITEVVVTCTASGTSTYGPGKFSSSDDKYSYSGTKGTWANSDGASKVTLSASAQVRMTEIKVTYISSGGGGGSTDPSISLGSTTINVTKAAVNTTTINVTYNNLTNYAADVNFYESDGTTDATYDHSWMTAEINASNKLEYSITENTGFERKAYFKVYAVGDEGEAESSLITVTQKGAKYKVYIQTPTGGTLEVKNGETLLSDGDAVDDDATLTITPTAADGYRYRNWQYKKESGNWTTNTTATTYKMTSENVQFRANFDWEYSVNWSVNGNVTTEKYVNNETIVFPSRPADVLGKKFVGWTATEIDGTQAEAPTLLAYGTKMGTSNVTYYAVFADASGTSGTATLTESEITTNFTNATMAYGTEKSFTDTSDGITWVACGWTDAASRKWIQLRSKADAYFKVSTQKNIEEVKLTITGNTYTGSNINDITKYSAFSNAVCLGSEAKGTPTSEYASSSTVSNNTVTVSLPVSLKEFYIQTTGGGRVWGIELTTNNYTYSNYCTAVSVPATISTAEYATFVNATHALDFSGTGISVYTATDMGSYVKLNEITSGDVPANTPVVLYKANGGTVNVPVIASADEVGDNDLCVSTGTDVANMFVLSNKKGVVGFYKWAGSNLSKGKVYLQGQTSGARDFLGFEETTTGIANVEINNDFDDNTPMYNLAGQKVGKSYKGIVVVNGKKVVRK